MPSGHLWEWVVDQGAVGASYGVSRAQHRAMEALSQTLIACGAPASGHVVQIALVDGAYGFRYVRLVPALTADYEEEGIIRWH
jgi:hypothetical protein